MDLLRAVSVGASRLVTNRPGVPGGAARTWRQASGRPAHRYLLVEVVAKYAADREVISEHPRGLRLQRIGIGCAIRYSRYDLLRRLNAADDLGPGSPVFPARPARGLGDASSADGKHACREESRDRALGQRLDVVGGVALTLVRA